jgi:hypothetical protein
MRGLRSATDTGNLCGFYKLHFLGAEACFARSLVHSSCGVASHDIVGRAGVNEDALTKIGQLSGCPSGYPLQL